MDKNKVKSNVCIAFVSVIYIALCLFKHYIRISYNYTYIAGTSIPVVTVTGTCSSLILLIAVLIAMSFEGKFISISWFLQTFEIVIDAYTISYFNINQTIPGLVICIVGLIITFRLSSYMKYNKVINTKLSNLAIKDTLTGCLNRRGLIDELLRKASIGNEFFLVILDLDNFKQVNDTLGHGAGDELLVETAKRWSNIKTGLNYNLSRLGGDEFAMVVDTSDHTEVQTFMDSVMESVSSYASKYSSYVTASAGIAHYTRDTSSIEQLLSYADTAMYKSKSSGKNSYCFFDADMYEKAKDTFYLEESIKDALTNDTFEMVYQPQYDIKTKEIVGLESLIRLRKDGRTLNTQALIDVAEKSGLILSIDDWVVERVMSDTRAFIQRYPNVDISINVSGGHLSNLSFMDTLVNNSKNYNYALENIKLEITESSYIKCMDDALNIISVLKNLGVKIALDDFGTGYSSLKYLAKMPVDLIKIDKSFIDGIETDKVKRNFVEIIIDLGHLRNCDVIAEGVETEKQVEILNKLKCDSIQGYVWGKPAKIEDLF